MSKVALTKSFFYYHVTGDIYAKESLDREKKEIYELVAEARDQGVPPRSSRVPVRIIVTDVNDNAPELLDPREDVVSVREEQPGGTEVTKIKAIDKDKGKNSTITYSILKGAYYLLFLIPRQKKNLIIIIFLRVEK